MAAGFKIIEQLNKNSKSVIEEATPKGRFQTRDIPIAKIYSNSMNFYPQEGIEEKAREILAVGLLENLVVKYEPCESGEYKLISGERRWRGLKLLTEQGHKEFEYATCQIRNPENEHEEKIELILANSNRVKSAAVLIQEEEELKKELEYMKEKGMKLKGHDLQKGRLRDVIADMLKMSKTKIAQVESVSNNLIPEFKEELKKENLTFSAAYELSGMAAEMQRLALEKYIDTGELTLKDIKAMKEEGKEERIAGQIEIEDMQQEEGPEIELETEEEEISVEEVFTGMNPPEETTPGDDYEMPHPEGITSICFSCTEYETCNVKTGTCTKCDQYNNRSEAYKTEEEKYSEEQEAIDRETAKRLREQEENKQMENLPSDTVKGARTHQIRIAAKYYEDAKSGKKPFELRKNDRDYREGEILEMMEFKEGRNTGRLFRALVTYMLEDYTGLEEGYCILGTKVLEE